MSFTLPIHLVIKEPTPGSAGEAVLHPLLSATFGSFDSVLYTTLERAALVEATGFEPTTPWLQTRCSTN